MRLFSFNASASDELCAFVEARRRRAVALMLASGPSADTSARQSALLQQHADVWGLNQAFLHAHLVPRFHYVEFKLRSAKDSSEQIWKRFFDARRRRRYNETTFMAPHAQIPVLLKTLRMGALPAAAVSPSWASTPRRPSTAAAATRSSTGRCAPASTARAA